MNNDQNGERPIQPIIQPVTIDTHNNSPNTGDGLNFITCEQTFTLLTSHFPLKALQSLRKSHSACKLSACQKFVVLVCLMYLPYRVTTGVLVDDVRQ